MSAAEVIGISVGLFAILSAIAGCLLWVIKAQISMSREFRPNGGTSTRDSLNRIETDVREIRGKVDDHIDWHMDHK
jgi:hypothetical protein